MPEPRTPREMRLAIREAEETLRLLQEADMMAGDWLAEYRLKDARAKLRQAERHFATKDQHDVPLKPLSPQVRKPRPSLRPKRRRYRCTTCFREALLSDEDYERSPDHAPLTKVDEDHWTAAHCGDWELVARMPAGKADV